MIINKPIASTEIPILQIKIGDLFYLNGKVCVRIRERVLDMVSGDSETVRELNDAISNSWTVYNIEDNIIMVVDPYIPVTPIKNYKFEVCD